MPVSADILVRGCTAPACCPERSRRTSSPNQKSSQARPSCPVIQSRQAKDLGPASNLHHLPVQPNRQRWHSWHTWHSLFPRARPASPPKIRRVDHVARQRPGKPVCRAAYRRTRRPCARPTFAWHDAAAILQMLDPKLDPWAVQLPVQCGSVPEFPLRPHPAVVIL